MPSFTRTPRQRFGLHVTLLHPGQGERLAQAWPELSSVQGEASFRVDGAAQQQALELK